MYDKKMTLTGMSAAAAWILTYLLKHVVKIDVPDEVGQSIVILGILLLGKFGRDAIPLGDPLRLFRHGRGNGVSVSCR